MVAPRNWRPGSFTKNFSWGKLGSGLEQLHKAINTAFDGKPAAVERDTARRRLKSQGINDFIPSNFFLLNRSNSRDFIVADELVLTALSKPSGVYFDRLAVFALNFSMVGRWQGAQRYQRYPAEWAKHFIVSRIYSSGRWQSELINAGEIKEYIASNPDYKGVWATKVATNLNYIYELADIRNLRSGLAEQWWTSAIYLALDRIAYDRTWPKSGPGLNAALDALQEEHVFELTAVPQDQGIIAGREVAELYFGEGGVERALSLDSSRPNFPRPPLVDEGLEKAALPVERIYASSNRQVRDRRLVAKIRSLYGDRCCVCGMALAVGNGLTYSEIGHIKPAGQPFNGPDHASNVLPFCPNHHRQFDRGSIYFEVDGNSAKVVDRCQPSTVDGRIFTPASNHPFDMDNLRWHAAFFLQR